MAGTYPDVPGPRMSYDKDGSVLARYNNVDDEIVIISSLVKSKLNSEDNIGALTINPQPTASEFYLGVIFPEERSIDGIFVSAIAPINGAPDQFMDIDVEYSTDTTNFIDGTWTVAYADLPFALKPKTDYRSSINNLSIASAVGIRIIDRANSGNTGQIKNLHLYGSIINDSNRLAFWHPEDDVPLSGAWLDFGNHKQATYTSKLFRLKNLSPSDTANTIRLSTQALTDTLPTNVSQYTLSYPDYDAGAFNDYIEISTLEPQEISDVIEYKRATLSNAIISTWSVRLFADVIDGWTV